MASQDDRLGRRVFALPQDRLLAAIWEPTNVRAGNRVANIQFNPLLCPAS